MEAAVLMDLPHDMIDRVLGRLAVRDIARVAATCTGIQIYAESVLRRRSAERMWFSLWRSTLRPLRPLRPNLEMDPNHIGFVTRAVYLAWFVHTTSMLDSDFTSRTLAVESLGSNPLLLKQYANVVVQIMLEDENYGVRLTALKALGKLEAVLLGEFTVVIESILEDNINVDDEYTEIVIQILCKIDPVIVVRFITGPTMNEHDHIREIAVLTLGELPQAAFEQYADDVVRVMHEDVDVTVQRAALETLGKLDPALLVKYGDDIERMIWSEDDFSALAWKTLLKLGREVLERYARAVVQKFKMRSSDSYERARALTALSYVDPTILKLFAGDVADQLKCDSYRVRFAALKTLYNIEPAVLQLHAGAVVDILNDDKEDDFRVRCQALYTLGKLEPVVLMERYASDVVRMLNDTDSGVRQAALTIIGKPELDRYTGDVVGMLTDIAFDVRYMALRILGTREPAVLQVHAGAVVDMLKSDRPGVLVSAMEALCIMPQVELEKHVDHVVHLLTLDGSVVSDLSGLDNVRYVALRTLQKIKPADLAKYIVVFVRALDYPYQTIRGLVMKMLIHIAPTDVKTHAVVMVQEGAIRPIAEDLDSEIDDENRMLAISSLNMIASVNASMDVIPTTASAMALNDIIPILVPFLYHRGVSEFTWEVIQTLVHLAAHSATNCARMVSEGVIPPVIDTIRGDEPSRVKEAAVLLLHTLSLDMDA